MATGFGLTKTGKHNGAGEELQDIDWDSIPPEKRGMGMTQPKPKMKADATLAEPDPWGESQLPPEKVEGSQLVSGDDKQEFYDDDCQLPLSERKKLTAEHGAYAEGIALDTEGETLDMGNEAGDSQVKNPKKVPDPTNGTKTRKTSPPRKRG